jgi:hypothetical protein
LLDVTRACHKKKAESVGSGETHKEVSGENERRASAIAKSRILEHPVFIGGMRMIHVRANEIMSKRRRDSFHMTGWPKLKVRRRDKASVASNGRSTEEGIVFATPRESLLDPSSSTSRCGRRGGGGGGGGGGEATALLGASACWSPPKSPQVRFLGGG